MCCSIWARAGKGLPGLGAARVWSRETRAEISAATTKRRGVEQNALNPLLNAPRHVPSPCRQQNLLQKAPRSPILASSQRSWRSGAPPQPCPPIPAGSGLGCLTGGAGLLHHPAPCGVCAPASSSPCCWSSPDATAVAGAPFGGTPGWGFALCFSGCCGDTAGTLRDRILRVSPFPSPPSRLCPCGVPSLQTLGGTRTPWHGSCQ